MGYRALLIAIAATTCTSSDSSIEQNVVAGTTVVSLTFDDTFADNYQVAALAEARGMHVTFFLNSARFDQSGYMTLAQVQTMSNNGHEIGGHTLTHPHLTQITTDEAARQICNDRVALLDLGFRVTSFAYPFSDQNAAVRQIVSDCGYNSARLVGGLVMPTSCNGCPYANPIPPPDPYQVRTNDSVKSTNTLAELENYVTQAEQHGGGWVPMVFHHVCDGCDELSVSPSTLAAFMDWLRLRSGSGTVVATVDEVIGGTVKPGVPGPPPAGTNALQNASLETDADGDQVPDCWQRGGSGTNTSTYTLTSNAYDGARAQRIDVSSFTSGARRLVSKQDTGTCAPSITVGHQYTVTARYIANAPAFFSIYYRNASGTWTFFAQGPTLPTSSTYTLASYTTPAMPTGATAISVGLSLGGTGSLTMDAFTLVDASAPSDTTPPTVSLTAPAAGATVSGNVQVAATAADASGIARVEFLVNGNLIGNDTTSPYAVTWDSSVYAGQTVMLTARAYDTANNTTLSAARQVTVAPAQDITPPAVAMTSPANNSTVSGGVQLSADASDASGIARVEFLVNGAIVGTDTTSPYAVTWDSSAFAGQTVTLAARAFDNANNQATSATRSVTVATTNDTTPPTVALTSPADGATVSDTIVLSADAADAGGIARVEFFANSTLIATELFAPYELDWNTSAYAGQSVALTARAYDNAGNSTLSAPHQITVTGTPPADTTPPTVALTSPAAGATVSGIVSLTATASDTESGVAWVEFQVNGAVVTTDTTNPYSATWDSSAFAGQTVTLTARAVDNASNAATSSRQVTVAAAADTTPPTVSITSPAPNSTVSGTVAITATASDASGIARVEFLVNGALVGTDTTSPYSFSWNSAGSAGQTVTLAARAVDTANNTATASEQVTVAPAAPPNLIQNPSLETDANGDQIPDCWQRGGSGTNAATYTLTTNAFSGARAQRIDMTSFTSGARRLVTLQDSGTCAPAATAGRRYTVTARYIANAATVFTIYYRNASGTWTWFAQSPTLPTSSTYALGTYTTAPLPAGATAISVGLSLINLGSLTMDDFTLVDAGP